MTDRELLELAAKAAGIDGDYVTDFGSGDYYYQWNQCGILYELHLGGLYVWNPLTDDGDALRLAVKLNMSLLLDAHHDGCVLAQWDNHKIETESIWFHENSEKDANAATRRAIVRAAAEIGKGMQ